MLKMDNKKHLKSQILKSNQQITDLGIVRFYKMGFLDKQSKTEKYFP